VFFKSTDSEENIEVLFISMIGKSLYMRCPRHERVERCPCINEEHWIQAEN
jgi:hypothetical protein